MKFFLKYNLLISLVIFSCGRNVDNNYNTMVNTHIDISPYVSIVNEKKVDLLNSKNEGAYNVKKDISLQTGDLVERNLKRKPNPVFINDNEENRKGYKVIDYPINGYYNIKINSFEFGNNQFYTEVISIKSKNGNTYTYSIKAEKTSYSGESGMLGGSVLLLKKLWLDDKLVWELKLDEKGNFSFENYHPHITIVIPDNN